MNMKKNENIKNTIQKSKSKSIQTNTNTNTNSNIYPKYIKVKEPRKEINDNSNKPNMKYEYKLSFLSKNKNSLLKNQDNNNEKRNKSNSLIRNNSELVSSCLDYSLLSKHTKESKETKEKHTKYSQKPSLIQTKNEKFFILNNKVNEHQSRNIKNQIFKRQTLSEYTSNTIEKINKTMTDKEKLIIKLNKSNSSFYNEHKDYLKQKFDVKQKEIERVKEKISLNMVIRNNYSQVKKDILSNTNYKDKDKVSKPRKINTK